ncbi:MAG: tetratricopeptide repeat protein [Deltaproteobacteria bacterium]|nr:tetratricopeptide repeat protein [Deltaproteobacteria bacterium]
MNDPKKAVVERKPREPRKATVQDLPTLLGLARAFADAGDFAAAEAAAAAATLVDGRAFYAWVALGIARARLGRDALAVTAFLKALEIDPKAVSVWVDLGEIYLNKGRYELAAEALRNACELDKDGRTPPGRRARALIGRTIALLKKG